MPCCLTLLLALLVPRVLILVLWLFTGWFGGLFASAIWPVLGFFFLPVTLLWYTAVRNWYAGEWGAIQILVLIVAVIVDISPGGGGHRGIRRRWRRQP